MAATVLMLPTSRIWPSSLDVNGWPRSTPRPASWRGTRPGSSTSRGATRLGSWCWRGRRRSSSTSPASLRKWRPEVTIELSVSDVRAALMRAAGPVHGGSGEPATLLLGKVFHEVFADLVSHDPSVSGLRLIAESGPDPERRVEQLLEHVWRHLVAPRLRRHAAVLQTSSEAVLVLWDAIRNLARWMVGVVVELLEQSPEARASASHLERLLQAEIPL